MPFVSSCLSFSALSLPPLFSLFSSSSSVFYFFSLFLFVFFFCFLLLFSSFKIKEMRRWPDQNEKCTLTFRDSDFWEKERERRRRKTSRERRDYFIFLFSCKLRLLLVGGERTFAASFFSFSFSLSFLCGLGFVSLSTSEMNESKNLELSLSHHWQLWTQITSISLSSSLFFSVFQKMKVKITRRRVENTLWLFFHQQNFLQQNVPRNAFQRKTRREKRRRVAKPCIRFCYSR